MTPRPAIIIYNTTPAIKLKPGKGEGDIGFRSDHFMAHRDYLLFCRCCSI